MCLYRRVVIECVVCSSSTETHHLVCLELRFALIPQQCALVLVLSVLIGFHAVHTTVECRSMCECVVECVHDLLLVVVCSDLTHILFCFFLSCAT